VNKIDQNFNKSSPTIFLIVQLQFTVRYLLKTDLYKKLHELGLNIVILSPNGLDDAFRKEHYLKDVVFEKLDLDFYKKYNKKILYKYFLQVRRLTLPSLCDISTIKLKENFLQEHIKNYRLIPKLFYLFCIYTSRANRKIELLRKLFVFTENLIYKSNVHSDLYKKHNPSAIILNDLGTIESSNFIMREAKRNSTKIISLILSWDNLTSKGIGAVKPDYAVAWNKTMAQELEDYHELDKDRIYVGGIPLFDRFSEQINKNKTTKAQEKLKGKKFIYFGTGAPAWFTGNVNVVKLLLNYATKSLNNKELIIVVRPHPAYFLRGKHNEEIQEIKKLAEESKGIIHLNIPNFTNRDNGSEFTKEDQNAHEYFIRNCEVLITSYSTLMLEASIFNKPIINIGFDESRRISGFKSHIICNRETHLKKVLSYKFTTEAKTECEFTHYLDKYIKNPELRSDNRKKLFKEYLSANFGSSGKCIARKIKEIV
jgi:CDP-glycerol glycerophosphotransferase (TagB/SpsB family)